MLDVDLDRCALTIERAPARWLTSKERLFVGEIDPEIARRLG